MLLLDDEDDEHGRTALSNAVASQHVDMVQMLLDMGANHQLADAENGDYPLHEAVSTGNLQLVATLLSAEGANVNVANHDGATPLHWAVTANNRHMVKALVDAGADVYASDEGGEAPIWLTNDPAMLAVMGYKKCPCENCTVGDQCLEERYVVPL